MNVWMHERVENAVSCKYMFFNINVFSNLQINYHFKLDFQKMDQHIGGKCLINGTKHHKYNQLQSLDLPSKIF